MIRINLNNHLLNIDYMEVKRFNSNINDIKRKLNQNNL